MELYFPLILLINISVLFLFWTIISRSKVLHKNEITAFKLMILLIAVIAISEYIAIIINGIPKYRLLNYILSFLGFALPPFIVPIIVYAFKSDRKYRFIEFIPPCIQLPFLFSGQVFSISQDNLYSRENLFWIHFVVFHLTVFSGIIQSGLFFIKHQHKNLTGLAMLSVFTMGISFIQIFEPEIHLLWLGVTLSVLIYFIYYTDFIQQMDELTGLLNRRTFDLSLKKIHKSVCGIVIIDINNFKSINDKFGHLVGDNCLRFFGKTMRSVFSRYCLCYRFGGDEFLLLIRNSKNQEAMALKEKFDQAIKSDTSLPIKLDYSFGYVQHQKNKDIFETLKEADDNMYLAKTANKA